MRGWYLNKEVQTLLQRIDDFPHTRRAPGASTSDFLEFEQTTQLKLPPAVRHFYELCNGVEFQGNLFRVLSLSGAATHHKRLVEAGYSFPWQLLPVAVNDVWNTIAVCCAEPLTGYWIQISGEDGAAVLKWRSFERFLTTALAYFMEEDRWHLTDVPPEFDNLTRTEQDIATGRHLLKLVFREDLHDVTRQYAAEYGCELLGPGQLKEMAPLLDNPDFFVARNARARVARLGISESRALLDQYWADVKELLKRTANVLERGGFQSLLRNDFELHTEPGAINWNWEALYAEHKRPDYDDWVLSRARYFAEQKRKSDQ